MNPPRAERKADEARFWDKQVRKRTGFRRGFYVEINRYLWDLIISQLGNVHGRRVLFVGCGTSAVAAKEMGRGGADVWCLDISSASLVQLMHHPFESVRYRIHPVVADAERMPFASGAFDVVLGKAIVHHLDVAKFMAEMARVCREKALIVFSEPLGVNPLINLFRWLTPSSRVATEHPLVPSDLENMKQYCSSMRRRHSFLFALLSLPLFSLGLKGIGRLAFRVGCAFDRLVFFLCPASRWLAWNVTLTANLSGHSSE